MSGLSKSEIVLTFKAFGAAVVLLSNMHPSGGTCYAGLQAFAEVQGLMVPMTALHSMAMPIL